jgi:hypothetical protein
MLAVINVAVCVSDVCAGKNWFVRLVVCRSLEALFAGWILST